MSINIVLNALIHILILVLLFSFFINSKKEDNTIIFILCAITVFLCYMIEFVKKPDIMNIELSKEHFKSPIDQNAMGPYNKKKFDVDETPQYHREYKRADPNSKCKWRKEPCDVPLLNKIKFTAPVGIQERLNPGPHFDTFPTVDGKKDSPKSMFVFAYNQAHPDCCPSTYSTDRGCVCTTEQQRKFINGRGKNRSFETYPGI
jgi:hypothetical protein